MITMTWLRARRNEWHWDLLAVSVLGGMVTAFFWRTLSGDVYQPADGGDLVSFLFPTYRFAARTLSQGRLPLWNPHLYGGAPFIGDIQAGFLYPPNLLLFLLRPYFDYGWMQLFSIGHLWWAGAGVYVLVRTLGHSRPAALLAGLAFSFSDALFIHLGNLNLIAVLSWVGWILAAYQRALTLPSLAWAGISAALYALANYAGHAQSSYYIGMAVGVYTVVFCVLSSVARNWRDFWGSLVTSPLSTAVTVFILTLLISAPIFLPSAELLLFSSRAAFAYQETVEFSLAPLPALVGLLTPGFFGRGPALHWGLWERVELPYVGVVTLLLAAGSFLFPMSEKRRRLLPWLVLALFGLVVALGIYAPLHGWLTQILPGFGSFRAPARAIVLWALAVSVLAAMGLDALIGNQGVEDQEAGGSRQFPQPGLPSAQYALLIRSGGLALLLFVTPLMFVSLLVLQADPVAFLRASIAGLALVLATATWLATWLLLALYCSQRLSDRFLAGLLLLLLLVELAAAGAYTDISETEPTRGFVHPEIVTFLRGQTAAGGVLQDSQAASPPSPYRIDARTSIDDLWQPDTAALVGLMDVWGVANPLVLQHWEHLWESSGGRDTRLYDLFNVRFVLVRDGTPLPAQFTLAFDAPGPLAIYENPDPLPRAWLVANAQTVPNEEAALAALQQPAFDPLQTVILTVDAAPPTTVESPSLQAGSPLSVLSYTENEIIVAVRAVRPGYLVLSEVWYPGWRARVNGEAAPVLRANYALRAVPLPAGESTVRLWYAPDSWHWGLALFGLGIMLLVGLLLWENRRHQQR